MEKFTITKKNCINKSDLANINKILTNLNLTLIMNTALFKLKKTDL